MPLANPSVENREKKSARFEIARLTWQSFADLIIKSERFKKKLPFSAWGSLGGARLIRKVGRPPQPGGGEGVDAFPEYNRRNGL
jgi:hypothetical protein